ncbi:hypothetical protein [Enterobacter asburiae]|uniref:hypothetical protein n=1 Tax=Enterobacter asburiae TaxID=61645 RepID=UPI0012D3D4C0|nr:hypothetical protein [Enterobacter asburiae]
MNLFFRVLSEAYNRFYLLRFRRATFPRRALLAMFPMLLKSNHNSITAAQATADPGVYRGDHHQATTCREVDLMVGLEVKESWRLGRDCSF